MYKRRHEQVQWLNKFVRFILLYYILQDAKSDLGDLVNNCDVHRTSVLRNDGDVALRMVQGLRL